MDSIIVLRSAVLGDFIISMPAMNLIRQKNPNAKIYLLTIQSAHKKDRDAVKVYENKKTFPWLDLLDRKIIDEFIPMERMDFKYIFGILRPKIKKINPTKCYILTDPLVSWKSNIKKLILMKILGARCQIYGWRDFLVSKKEKINACEDKRCINHTLSCLESVLEDKSIYDEKITVEFPVVIPDYGLKNAEAIWNQHNLQNKRVYVISPGGIKLHKIWKLENFIEIIKNILRDQENVVILTGTVKDFDIGDRIEKSLNSKEVINLIGQTDLMTLAGILKKSYMLIGNDGGTMHLGDSVGCTVVALMPGIELPRSVEPWHNMGNSLRFSVHCAPCYDFDKCPQGNNECLRKIDVNRVLNAIKNADDNKKKYNRVSVYVNRSSSIPFLFWDNDILS